MHRTEDVSYSAGRADLVNGNVSASETLGKSVDGTESTRAAGTRARTPRATARVITW